VPESSLSSYVFYRSEETARKTETTLIDGIDRNGQKDLETSGKRDRTKSRNGTEVEQKRT